MLEAPARSSMRKARLGQAARPPSHAALCTLVYAEAGSFPPTGHATALPGEGPLRHARLACAPLPAARPARDRPLACSARWLGDPDGPTLASCTLLRLSRRVPAVLAHEWRRARLRDSARQAPTSSPGLAAPRVGPRSRRSSSVPPSDHVLFPTCGGGASAAAVDYGACLVATTSVRRRSRRAPLAGRQDVVVVASCRDACRLRAVVGGDEASGAAAAPGAFCVSRRSDGAGRERGTGRRRARTPARTSSSGSRRRRSSSCCSGSRTSRGT